MLPALLIPLLYRFFCFFCSAALFCLFYFLSRVSFQNRCFSAISRALRIRRNQPFSGLPDSPRNPSRIQILVDGTNGYVPFFRDFSYCQIVHFPPALLLNQGTYLIWLTFESIPIHIPDPSLYPQDPPRYPENNCGFRPLIFRCPSRQPQFPQPWPQRKTRLFFHGFPLRPRRPLPSVPADTTSWTEHFHPLLL